MKYFKHFFVISFFLIFTVNLYAQKTVKVGYYNNDGTLHEGFSDDARKSGYAYEFYQEVAKYTDWVFEYVYGSHEEIMQKLNDGEVDIVAGVTKTDDKLGAVLFPELPMGTQTYFIYAPMGMHVSDDIAAVLNNKRIGIKGKTYVMTEMLEDYAKHHNFKFEVVPYDTAEERVAAFHDGKIDFVLSVENENMGNLRPVYNLGTWDIYFAVNKFRPDILNELNEAMARLFNFDPYFSAKLTEKYFNDLKGGVALSDQEKIHLYEMKNLRFGYVTDSMPISANDSNGNIYGLARDLEQHLENYLGIEVIPVAFKGSVEMMAALSNHEIDVAFPVYNDAWVGEKQGYKQTSPIISHRVMLVYKGSYRPDLLKKIAIGKTTIGQRLYLQKYYPDSEMIEYETRADYFDAILDGEVNCTIGNESILQRFIRENPKYQGLNIVYLPRTEEFGLAVDVNNPLLLEALNKAVNQIDQAAIVNSLISYAYIDKPFSLSEFIKKNAFVFMLVLALLVVLIVLAFYNYIKKMQRTRAKEAKTQNAIREAYIATANANNAKSDFLANMSHDLRTPVNAIIGMSAIAEYNRKNGKSVDDCLEKITVSSKHLLNIINEILDMSKIESGNLGLKFELFNIDDLMQGLFKLMRPIADAKNIPISLSMEKVRHRNVVGDGNHLQQVFINLLENAIQYSNEGGKVDVTVAELPAPNPKMGCYEFTFQDKGIGMSDEFQKKLFLPFMRENEEKRIGKNEGTGLGLAISRNIVQMLGGDIKVYSRAGEGSKFTVTVFMEFVSEDNLPDASVESESDITLEEFSKTTFEGKRALLVEDNTLNAEITTEILKTAKMEVELAPDGMEAVSMMLTNPDGYYDIVFMDVQMPVMNGYETTAVIRTYDNEYMQKIPIITMTANAFADDIAHAQNSGMNGHLSKPINLALLQKFLIEWLGNGEKTSLDEIPSDEEMKLLQEVAEKQ